MPGGRPPATGWPAIGVIQEAVCDLFGVSRRELLSPRRKQNLVQARHAAFWLARQAGYSYPAIARVFGGRDHTTVIHGVSRVEQMLAEDPDYAAVVAKVAAVAGCTVPLPPGGRLWS